MSKTVADVLVGVLGAVGLELAHLDEKPPRAHAYVVGYRCSLAPATSYSARRCVG
jgi:hypothetical protein